MGERGVRNAEVRGSIPLISTYIPTCYEIKVSACILKYFNLQAAGCNQYSSIGSLIKVDHGILDHLRVSVIVLHSDLLLRVVYHLMNHPFFIHHNFGEIFSKNLEVYEISLISDEYGLYLLTLNWGIQEFRDLGIKG